MPKETATATATAMKLNRDTAQSVYRMQCCFDVNRHVTFFVVVVTIPLVEQSTNNCPLYANANRSASRFHSWIMRAWHSVELSIHKHFQSFPVISSHFDSFRVSIVLLLILNLRPFFAFLLFAQISKFVQFKMLNDWICIQIWYTFQIWRMSNRIFLYKLQLLMILTELSFVQIF